MLVLTRRSNQSIMIGDYIEVSVLSVMGDKVRLGIDAPADVPVFRTEIYLEIQSQEAEKEIAADEPKPAEAEARRESDVEDALRRLGESP
jgi:carbon storage regulator